MLYRNDNGDLMLKSLDLEIFLGDLFQKCKNEKEISWLQEQITSCAELLADERLEEL